MRRTLPTKSDAPQGALLALTSARRHLRAADTLSKTRLYGPACSHVILSLEELAKSWTLTLIGMGIDIPKKLVGEVLRNHDARHAITFTTLYGFMIQNMVGLAARRVQKRYRVKDNPRELQLEFEREVQKVFRSLRYKSQSRNPLLALVRLTSGANELKNRGLYVDFDGNDWTHPGRLSKKEFATAYDIAKALIQVLGQTIRGINKTGYEADEQTKAFLRDQFPQRQKTDPAKML